ncbi:Brix-domain-containing protein [Sistotremastrum niveocremeum HHB9708]|uniref:Ribosome production factor 2 homolog n=2 Tax=Sistotremastraceae TaxID=3402574 RepID=A0A164QLD7_9AGAM|nr:Brix-domain-containing protein [Sistotremastrum niveocremeum HHB9708]KZT33938.1 Brix-domain-containing protein [Sistotremastrum suecicum HHB10207 ss-3]
MEAREPKEVEDAKTVIFVKGSHTGETVNNAMKELMALKRPHAISFAKKNVVRPFEDSASLEFWSKKNDAPMFVVGQSTKKRPNDLTFARMFDGRLLDMVELGIDNFVGMAEFKTPKATPGHKPMLHFASELFDTHPRFTQLRSMLVDFFNGEVIESISLQGLEHVISITLGPTPPTLNTAEDNTTPLPKVHIRCYTLSLLASGVRIPRVELVPMGPSLDLTMRRHQDADPDLWKAAMKKPKMKKQDVEKGLGKKRKNMEVDDMGDLRGRLHVAKQDLSKLQTRKMKGLKDAFDADGENQRKRRKAVSEEADDDDSGGE